MSATVPSADAGNGQQDHVPGVLHDIETPAGGQKQEDVEDRPNVSTTTPDKYPEQQ